MSSHGFVRSLVFAAVAGLAAVAWLLATGPWLGRSVAISLFALLASWSYLVMLARRWSQRLIVAVLAGLCALVLALLLVPSSWSIGAAALLLGVTRSVFLYPSSPARSVVVELLLVAGGLVAARLLVAPSPLAVGLACWGFFLVQSTFFLVAVRAPSAPGGEEIDAFVQARDAAMGILRELP